ncbi:DUF3108 domain-containing protein [Ekhidna sp.]
MIPRLTIAIFSFQMLCLAFTQQTDRSILTERNLVDGSFIKDYTNKWKVTYVANDGKETPNKVWTDYGQIIELNGKIYFHRIQDLYDPKMNLQETWINMVEYPSLRPVSFSRTTPTGQFTFIQFDGNKVNSISNFQSESLTPSGTNVELVESAYDWNLYGMLLVALPFEEGLTSKLPFYSTQTGALDWLITTVEGQESLVLSNEEIVTTWKLSTNQNLTFWLTKSAPYVHRLELELQNNAKLIWETL